MAPILSWRSRAASNEAPTGPPSVRPSLASRMGKFLAYDLVVRLRQLLRLAMSVLEGLIALRILLKVAGANAGAGFSNFVYKVSDPFVAPFHPVFADQKVNGHPFEVGSLLAMVVYAVLAYLIARVVGILLAPPRKQR